MYVLLIILSLIIYLFYICINNCSDVNYEHQTNHTSKSSEESEDPMKYAYRRIIHNTGKYKEPVYYDPDTNYYNILQSYKLKPVKTNDKILNWTDILSNKYKSEQLNRENEFKILKEMENNGELDDDIKEESNGELDDVVKGEDINTKNTLNTNCWYNTMFNNKIINNSCSKRNKRLKEINNVNENYLL